MKRIFFHGDRFDEDFYLVTDKDNDNKYLSVAGSTFLYDNSSYDGRKKYYSYYSNGTVKGAQVISGVIKLKHHRNTKEIKCYCFSVPFNKIKLEEIEECINDEEDPELLDHLRELFIERKHSYTEIDFLNYKIKNLINENRTIKRELSILQTSYKNKCQRIDLLEERECKLAKEKDRLEEENNELRKEKAELHDTIDLIRRELNKCN